MRSTNNENPVERKLRELFRHYGFIVKFLENISREQDVLFFLGIRFWRTMSGHKIPYPKGYILGNFKLWLISKNHCGGPLKSNVAMVTKFPTLQQLHLGENGFLIGFSLGMTPKFCCRVLSLIRFQVLLKKP